MHWFLWKKWTSPFMYKRGNAYEMVMHLPRLIFCWCGDPINGVSKVRFNYSMNLTSLHMFCAQLQSLFYIASTSASLESLIQVSTGKAQINLPRWSLRTPPTPAVPGFPRAEPSTFHFKHPDFGFCHTTAPLLPYLSWS